MKAEDIIKDPCLGCPDIQCDSYGYLCDLSCGKRTAYLNKLAGADALLQGLKKEAIHIKTVQGWKYLKIAYKDWLHGNRVGWIAFIEED